MNEQLIAQEIVKAMSESQAVLSLTDVVIIVGIIVVAVVYIYRTVREIKNGNSTSLSREAHEIITKKDDYGQPVLLGMVKHLREFKEGVRAMQQTLREVAKDMRQLCNHQTETLKRIDKRVNNLEKK